MAWTLISTLCQVKKKKLLSADIYSEVSAISKDCNIFHLLKNVEVQNKQWITLCLPLGRKQFNCQSFFYLKFDWWQLYLHMVATRHFLSDIPWTPISSTNFSALFSCTCIAPLATPPAPTTSPPLLYSPTLSPIHSSASPSHYTSWFSHPSSPPVPRQWCQIFSWPWILHDCSSMQLEESFQLSAVCLPFFLHTQSN